MVRHGNPPFLECSSAGDRRFSAFYARVAGREGRTIEEIYQAAKVFKNGDTGLSIKEAKGFRPVNHKECMALYATLWDEYITENPSLLLVLTAASGLSDRFGRPGGVCQATELWRIREAALAPPFDPKTYVSKNVFNGVRVLRGEDAEKAKARVRKAFERIGRAPRKSHITPEEV